MSKTNGNGNGHKGTPRAGKKSYSVHVVAKALAMLVAGESVQAVADKLNIPKQNISRWKEDLPPQLGQIGTKKEVIQELVWQNLESILRANLAQLKVASDEEWLRKHTPDSLAILYGTICDKGFRFLDGAARAEQQSRQLGPAEGDSR
jgi:hypothetical protein